jgi:hypothetical protein
MAELELPKLAVRVRFPSPAPPQAQVNGLPSTRRLHAVDRRALHVPYAVAAILRSMAITIRDLRAAEARRRDLQTNAPAAASVIRDYHHRITQQMAETAGIHRITQQMAETAATDIRRTYQTLGLAAEAIRTYRQLQQMTERHSAGTAVGPRETVPPIDALVGIAPAGVDWPPLGRFTLRVLLATVTLALIILVWEEGREDAPAVTLAVIYGLVSGWQQFDEAIRKDS